MFNSPWQNSYDTVMYLFKLFALMLAASCLRSKLPYN